MKFKTETGSLYEIDSEKKQVRRLSGVLDPTPRQGTDGEWRAYVSASDPEVGKRCWVDWDGYGHCTVTSRVAEIVEEH